MKNPLLGVSDRDKMRYVALVRLWTLAAAPLPALLVPSPSPSKTQHRPLSLALVAAVEA